VGAIVFVEHWIFPRIGFTQFWASRKGLVVSWPALVAWLGSVALAVVAWQSGWIHLFFLALPVWVLTAVVYTALSAVSGAREALPAEAAPAPPPPAYAAATTQSPGPRTAAWTVAGLVTLATLVALFVLPFWVFVSGVGEWESRLATFKTIAAVVTVLYFVAGTVWMNENEKRRAGGAR
jgi:NCS1 family nucleobase:cation symporter-1